MVGFPGEKKKHFDNLIDFVKEVRFDRMGAFTFYAEEGTPAECMAGQVSEATKKKRLDALMRVQEEISRASSAASCVCSSTGSCPKRASPKDAPSAKRPRSTAS